MYSHIASRDLVWVLVRTVSKRLHGVQKVFKSEELQKQLVNQLQSIYAHWFFPRCLAADDLPSVKESLNGGICWQPSEGATLPCRSTRLRQDGRQGMMKASSMLPYAQAIYTQYTCTLGPKQPPTLLMARPTATHATKQELKSWYVVKVLTNDQIFFQILQA